MTQIAQTVSIATEIPVRFSYEFTCDGCGRDVFAAVHHGHARMCLMCQYFGAEMSKELQDRAESPPKSAQSAKSADTPS